jgi:hypothetical protein
MTPDDDLPEIELDMSEDEGYEPQPAGLSEDDVFIFDRAEFEEAFNCYAVMNRGGQLWVLDKDSRRWAVAEAPEHGDKSSRKLKTVQ